MILFNQKLVIIMNHNEKLLCQISHLAGLIQAIIEIKDVAARDSLSTLVRIESRYGI